MRRTTVSPCKAPHGESTLQILICVVVALQRCGCIAEYMCEFCVRHEWCACACSCSCAVLCAMNSNDKFVWMQLILQHGKATMATRVHPTSVKEGMRAIFVFPCPADEHVSDLKCISLPLCMCLMHMCACVRLRALVRQQCG
jgi:hypothetical protein